MKIKNKPTQLEQVVRVLDAAGVTYMKAEVKARDDVEKKEVDTIVILCGAVFSKDGRYMFAAPILNPFPSKNHKPEGN